MDCVALVTTCRVHHLEVLYVQLILNLDLTQELADIQSDNYNFGIQTLKKCPQVCPPPTI